MIMAYVLPVIEDAIPSTYREVEISYKSEMRKEVMLEEMNSLYKNDTWKLSKFPKGKKVIGYKWVYTKKQESQDGATVHYKAKLLPKDYA